MYHGGRMNNAANITPLTVTYLQCEEGKEQTLFSDTKTPRLDLRVTKSGNKSYILETKQERILLFLNELKLQRLLGRNLVIDRTK